MAETGGREDLDTRVFVVVAIGTSVGGLSGTGSTGTSFETDSTRSARDNLSGAGSTGSTGKFAESSGSDGLSTGSGSHSPPITVAEKNEKYQHQHQQIYQH